jgi:hypothetical protein
MGSSYSDWLGTHLKGARAHYARLCQKDDREFKKGGSSEYNELAHQMFGYIAALEACERQIKMKPHAVKSKAAPKKGTSGAKR